MLPTFRVSWIEYRGVFLGVKATATIFVVAEFTVIICRCFVCEFFSGTAVLFVVTFWMTVKRFLLFVLLLHFTEFYFVRYPLFLVLAACSGKRKTT